MKANHCFPVKISAPTLPMVLDRKRLYRQLDEGRQRSIIWITGLPGAGKTTLVASYLRTRKLPALWYQVDEGDADLANLFHYLSLACKKAAPRYRKPLPKLTPDCLPGLPAFTHRFFEQLYARLKAPSAVVFDNFQAVSRDAKWHDVLQIGLMEVPQGISVFIISREDPPPMFARLQVGQAMARLGADALRLTEEEAQAIMLVHARKQRTTLTKSVMEDMYQKTKGWVAGLVLLLEMPKGCEKKESYIPSESSRVLFDYLAIEVFKGLKPETQEFLLKTAFFPAMTSAMAMELTECSSADHILRWLYETKYFTERRFDAEAVYQYHPLFREFLLTRAKESLSSGELTRIQQHAAILLEKSGQAEEAVSMYREAGSAHEAVRMIVTHAPVLLAQGRSQTLEEWIHGVPQEIVDQNPWVQFWLASCRLPLRPFETEGMFAQAFEIFMAQRDRTGALLAWCGAVESILLRWEDLSQLDIWMDRLKGLLAKDKTFPSPHVEGRIAFDMFSAMMYRKPHDPEISQWMERTKSLLPIVPDPSQQALVGFNLMFYLTWKGDYLGASDIVNTFRHLQMPGRSTPTTQAMAFICEGHDYTLQGDADRALSVLQKGMTVVKKSGVYFWDLTLLSLSVYACLHAGRVQEAQTFLEEMKEHSERATGMIRSHYQFLAGSVAFCQNDVDLAKQYVDKSLRGVLESGVTSFPLALNRLLAMLILHEQGKQSEAQHQYELALKIAKAMDSHLLKCECYFLDSWVKWHKGQEAAALQALQKGLKEGRAHRIFHLPVGRSSQMAFLCAKALEHGIEVDYAQDLIRKKHLVFEDSTLGPSQWPWPVKVFTLGRFELEVNGKPVPFSRKVPRRPLTLLKAIIALGERNVSKVQLADALWPEADGDMAHAALATTLERLRKLVGHEKAIQLREGQVTLNPQVFWIDVWAFEALVTQVAEVTKNSDQTKYQEYTKRAVTLYLGSFLPSDSDEPWTELMRDRIRTKYVQHLGNLCQHWSQTGQGDKAVLWLEQALDQEPLAEPLYQNLMTRLHEMGRDSQVAEVYDRCRKTFARELGREPSPETHRIFKSCRIAQ